MNSFPLARRFPRPQAPRWLGIGLLSILPAFVHAQPRYTVVDLGDLGGSASLSGTAINAAGDVVGWEVVRTSPDVSYALFVHSGATFSLLPSPGDFQENIPNAINTAGAIVGTSRLPGLRGFMIANGAASLLADTSTANAINDAGAIAGLNSNGLPYVRSAGGVVTVLPTLPGAIATTVTGIDAAGNVVGFSRVAGGVDRAFSARPGSVTSLGIASGSTATTNTKAWAVNAAGAIAGSSQANSSGLERAVMFSGGAVVDRHGFSAFPRTVGLGINASGTMIGAGYTSANVADTNAVPCVYTDFFNAMSSINQFVVNLSNEANRISGITRVTGINDAGQISGEATSLIPFGVKRRAVRLDPVSGPSVAPRIAAEPQARAVAAGGRVTFSVTATGSPLNYEWRRNNSTTSLGGAASYTIPTVSAADAGTYTVRVFNDAGSVTSNAVALAVGPVSTVARLSNLSILTSLTGANDSFTLGYVVGGAGTSGTKALVIRAVGPSLTPLGVAGALADPKLETFAGATKTGENDNWGGGFALQAAMDGVGAFALGGGTSRDAAIATNVVIGDNSVKVSPVGNLSGAVIAEIYDGNPATAFSAATPRLINVSVLKNIGTSLTAGFVIGGAGSRTVLIRAVGPTLGAAPFNVPGVVADPQLALFNASSAKIGENDNWGGTAALSAAFTAVGAFQLSSPTSRDAALLATLTPGNYTVQVSGVGNTTGTALVEVYEVP